MKTLITTIAAVLVVGCGESQPPEPPKGKAPDISIHKAVALGNIKAVKQHLATGTDVNTKDLTGFAPLVFAASIGHKEIAKLLIAKGADVNVKISGKTPLDWAIKQNHTETAELLRKHGGKRGSELPLATLFEAVKQVDLQGVKDFLAKGADVNAKDWDGWTSLDNAISNGHKEIVELLIASGADVNAKDGDGFTPLVFAVDNGHKEIVEILIAKGADVNAKDGDGWTPLYYAANITGGKEIVELLIANGVDVNAKNEDGFVLLDHAILNDYTEITDLLRKHGGKTSEELNDTAIIDLLHKHGGKTGEELKAEGK
jgi:cytohesin